MRGIIISIRNAAKAIIINSNKILLNKYYYESVGEYYTLPGGGQNKYETLEEAIVRECLEETGYSVIVQDFVGLFEEINTVEHAREVYPNYTHKIWHIFRCTLKSEISIKPTEVDAQQIACEWIDISKLLTFNILPAYIKSNLESLISTTTPKYLGTQFIDYEI